VVGTLIGLALGSAAGGLSGLVLFAAGLGLGFFYDHQLRWRDVEATHLKDRPLSKAELDSQARSVFARYLSSLFVRVAEADGELSREEVAAIRSFFQDNLGFDSAELEQVRQELQAARTAPQPLPLACAAARELMGEADLSLLFYALWRVAAADRPVGRPEELLLAEIARELGLDPAVAAAMGGARHIPPPRPVAQSEPEPRSAYQRLGLTRSASDGELKKAYRGLAQKLHPDKVAHLGPRAVELAARAFSEVNLAYEEIRNERGL